MDLCVKEMLATKCGGVSPMIVEGMYTDWWCF